MNSQTLGQFLLSRYMGALLPTKEPQTSAPDSVGAMVDPLDNLLSEHVLFRFRQDKPSLTELGKILVEYYQSIEWRIDLQDPQDGILLGNLYPAEAETFLLLTCFYVDGDVDILSIATLPLMC